MQSKTLFLATALAILPAGAAFAQSATTPAPAADPATPPAAATDAAASGTTTSAPTTGAAADAGASATAAATQADLKAGAAVYDSTGATVGTIQSVTATGAVVASGKLRAEIPAASFAKNSRGLVIGITKAEFEAAVNRAKS